MKFLSAVVLLAVSAVVPSAAFVTPSRHSASAAFTTASMQTVLQPAYATSALSMVATDLDVGEDSVKAPRKTREVC